MQDRFKFRVWCKNKKEWEKDEIMITNNGKYFVTSSDIKKPFLITDADPIHHEINFCTGLKDKNGKLMYENDVLKDDHGALFQIKWCYNGYELRPLFRGGYSLGLIDEEFEVIGNIYENPELLRGDD